MDNNLAALALAATVMSEDDIVSHLESEIRKFRQGGKFENLIPDCMLAVSKHSLIETYKGNGSKMTEAMKKGRLPLNKLISVA